MATKKLKVIGDKDLQKLKKESKCCIIINDLVYDVTAFLEHPGGFDVLKEHDGKDATEAFQQIGHSPSAKKLMKKFLIGIQKNSTLYNKKAATKMVKGKEEFVDYSEEETKEETEAKEGADANGKTSKKEKLPEEEKVNYPLVASAILLFSITYYFLFLKK
ncbi:cytochrome b5, putative [Plasmodium knowlesi strain H]|uniref:Cytochrome b5, putative n=3 Tax=Plasmodium knowlesi TaxID=5850 RepID=A0A5K1UL05_PLAKH|nr:cytochrome b5, putative [Plasmodium knowlesi strain H]OTN63896.1 putative Cytochrome b5 [Plasmodium knowlesi]CAA9991113.1 cytochrome b5, putative [Plasmodium knowlesi strain H]SBO20576.1 cytochrome b5, putative [Plasmodium knowlesi strain H]SBO20970.1 cytochrome b5, putative [Plasmodium knowlesi strain H]VVS80587.1 cytochrome b5, putative [Plasmodium knowlesi strain H]|eukprot:XP_002262397.1 Cytochrome b5, putative [Plasmodium knowlesi strain H]